MTVFKNMIYDNRNKKNMPVFIICLFEILVLNLNLTITDKYNLKKKCFNIEVF